MYNPEKLATYVTQEEIKQNEDTTQYVLGINVHKKIKTTTNNVNKT